MGESVASCPCIVHFYRMKGKTFLFALVIISLGRFGFGISHSTAQEVGPGIVAPGGGGGFLLRDRQTVLFLGDSITAGGTYVSYIDTFVRTRFPEWDIEMIPFGLGSETASGLSEPDHPFPRPCVHGRLDRVLEVVKPDLTVVCYGMNDGIYYPFSEERFGAYKEGIDRLVSRLRDVGSKVILMTPPPFDGEQMKEKLKPAGEEEYSYKAVYQGYNDVLGMYAKWIMERSKGDDVVRGVDLYTPMQEHLETRHKEDENFNSGDGIHPKAGGHLLMAKAFLKAIGAPSLVAVREAYLERSKEFSILRVPLPFPRDPAWKGYGIDTEALDQDLSRFVVTVVGEPGVYLIKEGGESVGEVEIGQSGRATLNLSELEKLLANRQAAAVLAQVNKRRSLVAKACSAEIGDFRKKGTVPEKEVVTIEEILNGEEVKKLKAEIRARCVPTKIELSFEKKKKGEEEKSGEGDSAE